MSTAGLRNIGPKSAAWLRQVGLHTQQDLINSGAVAAFAINAVSYLGIIGALLRMPRMQAPDSLPREHLGAAIATGLRYVFMSPNIEVILLRGALFGFSGIGAQALLPVVARDSLQSGPLVYGLLLGALGVGALLGALLLSRLRTRFGQNMLLALGAGGFAAATAVLALVPNFAAVLAALVVGGAAWLLSLSTLNASMMRSVPTPAELSLYPFITRR